MKKAIIFVCTLLACIFNIQAQSFVSTEPSNRKVILEEFTGRGCGYCPDGHRIANEIHAAHPNSFWPINIHAGGYALSSYPNFITTDGTTIHNGFNIDGYPSGVVNRISQTVSDRGQWASQTEAILSQSSCANIAAIGFINPNTRMLHLIVELYYTDDSPSSTNKVSVALLQNNILGSQADYGNFNPDQWINGQYNHTHIFRDMISATWGDVVSETSAGSFHQLTYDYQIPEQIGSPNGVNVVLENLEILVWVAKDNYNIITANQALLFISSNEAAINPYIYSVEQGMNIECSNAAQVKTTVMNIGTNPLTSMKLVYDYNGYSFEKTWEGNIAQYSKTDISTFLPSDINAKEVNVTITEANGTEVTIGSGTTATLNISPYQGYSGYGSKLAIKIWQDRYGNQTTWSLFNSNGIEVASGGPYNQLPGNNTKLQLYNYQLSSADCYRFIIYDSHKDGINCGYGAGHYQIEDGNGNVIFSHDGVFTDQETTDFYASVEEAQTANINPEIAPTNSGTVVGSGNYIIGEDVILYAIPNSGYKFLNWTVDGNVISSDNMLEYNVKATNNIVANFKQNDGINNFANNIDIYPNPVNNILTINNANNATSIEIYNIQGQMVSTCNFTNKLDVSNLTKGMYFIKIISDNGYSAIKKFVKH